MGRTGARLQWVRGKEINAVVVNRPFKSLRSEREKGGLWEKETLTYLHWKFTNNVLLIPFPSSMYELPFFYFFLFLLYFVIFILKIREVSRPHNFNSQPLIHLRHLLKEAYMYSSLYKFLSLTIITQSPSNHRASFVFCTTTACMMSGTGIHWCQSKIKFCFKTLQILQTWSEWLCYRIFCMQAWFTWLFLQKHVHSFQGTHLSH